MRFKDLEQKPERESPKMTISTFLLAVGLNCYKWYQSQTPNDVLARRLSSEGGGHEAMCQQGCWAPKGSGFGGDPTSIVEKNECQQGHCAPKESGLWDPTSIGEENETSFIRVWKTLPSRHVLKTLRGSSKGKAQKGHGLGCFKILERKSEEENIY